MCRWGDIERGRKDMAEWLGKPDTASLSEIANELKLNHQQIYKQAYRVRTGRPAASCCLNAFDLLDLAGQSCNRYFRELQSLVHLPSLQLQQGGIFDPSCSLLPLACHPSGRLQMRW